VSLTLGGRSGAASAAHLAQLVTKQPTFFLLPIFTTTIHSVACIRQPMDLLRVLVNWRLSNVKIFQSPFLIDNTHQKKKTPVATDGGNQTRLQWRAPSTPQRRVNPFHNNNNNNSNGSNPFH
jgi:hypothetical protein